jgi:GT2 family glycosyltransferase
LKQRDDAASVVICAYTELRWDALCAAVQAVEQQTIRVRELIVVIDHNPVLLERAKCEFPHVKVIPNSFARGLSGARNSGIAAARGAIVAFVDEDAVPETNWLELLLTFYDDPLVMGVGGAIFPQWEDGKPSWFPDEFLWVVGCTYRGMHEQLAPVRNLIGCNMSFRRSVFSDVGGFHQDLGRIGTLPVGCEETEFCIRVRQQFPRHILLFEPEASVAHRVPASRKQAQYFVRRCYAEGISKAQISTLVGDPALETEKGYVKRTLPSGIVRNLGEAVRGDVGGLARASAIVLGLTMTTLGFLRGTLMRSQDISRLRQTPQNSSIDLV